MSLGTSDLNALSSMAQFTSPLEVVDKFSCLGSAVQDETSQVLNFGTNTTSQSN